MKQKIVNKETKAEYEVDVRIEGETHMVCPECSKDRKKSHSKCFDFNYSKGYGRCNHCGMVAYLKTDRVAKKEYVKPQPRLEKLRPALIEWFEKRGISNYTLLRFNVTETEEWMPKAEKIVPAICFNYYRNEKLVNIKFRAQNKDFKLSRDAELIFYNIDSMQGSKEVVIVEGEIDAMAMYEAGVHSVVSVPNGATTGIQRLEYLDNCIEDFEAMETVIIATDADEPGYTLREELARRIGKEKCKKVTFPEDCKDANDVLLKYGKEALFEIVSKAAEFPIEGVLTMDEMFEDVLHFFEHGYPQGVKVGIEGFDDYLTLADGQLTMVTGAPSSGKSEFIDWIISKTMVAHGWSWVICSFENQPSSFHVTKIMEKLTGKAFGFRQNVDSRMTRQQFEKSIITVDQYAHFINLKNVDLSLTGLLTKIKELVKRKGVKGVVIDPWNYIESKQPRHQTETQYINDCLSEIKASCLMLGIHLFLVAHPVKLKKDNNGKYEVATLYHINGSAHFYNKTDNGLSIYRDRETGIIDVHVQKVRFSWYGKEGLCSFRYDADTRQYSPLNAVTHGYTVTASNFYEPNKAEPF